MKNDSEVAQVVLEALGDLLVDEAEEARTPLDDRNLHPERGKHRRVLDSHDARAHDQSRGWDVVEEEQAVGVDDALIVEIDRERARGAGTGGDQDPLGPHAPAFVARDGHGVRVDEARAAGDHGDVVSEELIADDVDLAIDDLAGSQVEILDRDLLLHAIALAVRRPLAQSREVHDRLPEGLRRDRPPVD
jgi:hypothetical protein